MTLQNDEERTAFKTLGQVHKQILDWGLRVNQAELSQAIHVLQGFIIQHMLERIAPDEFGSNWYGIMGPFFGSKARRETQHSNPPTPSLLSIESRSGETFVRAELMKSISYEDGLLACITLAKLFGKPVRWMWNGGVYEASQYAGVRQVL